MGAYFHPMFVENKYNCKNSKILQHIAKLSFCIQGKISLRNVYSRLVIATIKAFNDMFDCVLYPY